MIKRSLLIESPCYVSTRMNQLVLFNKITKEDKLVPLEDIGFVIFEDHSSTFTLQALAALTENNVAVAFCDQNHLPTSLLLNLEGNTVHSQLFQYQLDASAPLKKQLWQQTIKAKIKNQAALLESLGKEALFLRRFATKVKSGDLTNEEAKASRYYWGILFEGTSFTRDRGGPPPNNLLNYGYIILRAAVARSLTGSGLLPVLGIHHHNKYNAYCLADDIMEPYRPWIDRLVVRAMKKYGDISVLTKDLKAYLLSVLSSDVYMNGTNSPLMVALSQTTASLADCFSGERTSIKYPEFQNK